MYFDEEDHERWSLIMVKCTCPIVFIIQNMYCTYSKVKIWTMISKQGGKTMINDDCMNDLKANLSVLCFSNHISSI